MWASLILDTLPWFASGGAGALAWYVRGAMNKPKPTPKAKTLMEVMEQGNAVVAQMAADVHKLYHPPGQDGKPCACAMCEIRADDEPAPEPAPEPDRECSPEFVKALKQKIDGLRKENAQLRKGSGQRVVTKVEERKTPLQLQIEQAQQMVGNGKPIMLNLEPSDMTNGHPMHVLIAPKVEPDYQIEQFGGGIVRSHYPRPQSGPGSKELGVMDRAIGTIGHKCSVCGDTAWKYGRLGPDFRQQYLCKNCWHDEYARGTSDVV